MQLRMMRRVLEVDEILFILHMCQTPHQNSHKRQPFLDLWGARPFRNTGSQNSLNLIPTTDLCQLELSCQSIDA